jgi:hypothetical protein
MIGFHLRETTELDWNNRLSYRISETGVRQTLSAGGSLVSSAIISTIVLSKSNGLRASQTLLPGRRKKELPRLCLQSRVDDVVHDVTAGACYSVIIHKEFPQVRNHIGRNEIDDLFRHEYPVSNHCQRAGPPATVARFPMSVWDCLAKIQRWSWVSRSPSDLQLGIASVKGTSYCRVFLTSARYR